LRLVAVLELLLLVLDEQALNEFLAIRMCHSLPWLVVLLCTANLSNLLSLEHIE